MTALVHGRRFDTAIFVLAALAAWQLFYQWAGPDALSPPLATIVHAIEMLGTSNFWRHAASTGQAFVFALAVAIAGGLLIGLLIGRSRLARDVGEPMLGTMYAIPKITLYPVILLIFGLGLSAKVAFGALHGIFPVALYTIGALKNVRKVYLKTGRTMRLSGWQTVRHILMPAAIPEIMTGVRIGFSTTLLGTLVGELFASDRGLGYAVIRAMHEHRVDEIMALTLILFTFAAVTNTLLVMVEKRLNQG